MKIVSVRDLRYDFKAVERLLREGEEVQITKRRRAIARLVPEPQISPDLPDFMEQLHTIYDREYLPVSSAEIVRLDRERY
ncbi:MAG: hypothetical protein WCA21_17775 [Terracidiphilus sp.]